MHGSTLPFQQSNRVTPPVGTRYYSRLRDADDDDSADDAENGQNEEGGYIYIYIEAVHM